MSDEFDDESNTDGAEGTGMKQLRAQLKKLAADNAALAAENAKHQVKARADDIVKHLTDPKVGGKASWAKYAARDIEGDITAEAVARWLETEGPDLGWSAPEADEDVDNETVSAARQISRATSNAPSGTAGITAEWIRTASPTELKARGVF